ncbi:hypothetical protein ACWF94_16885 [Streptomyces sp. NPDC055078]
MHTVSGSSAGDDELFDLVGAVGTAINASRGEELPSSMREAAGQAADELAAQLADEHRAGG